MIDSIREIPGPIFLLVLPVMAFCIVFLIRQVIKILDHSEGFSLPPGTLFDPYTLAILKGGIKFGGLLRMAIFRLHTLKLIEISGKGKDSVVFPRKKDTDQPLEILEEAVLAKVKLFEGKNISLKDLSADKGLKKKAEKCIEESKRKLESFQMIFKEDEVMRNRLLSIFGIGSILFIAITKLILGILHDRPIIFLSIELPVIVGLSIYFLKTNHITIQGKKHLKALEKEYEWLKGNMQANRIPADVNPNIALALFGVSMLAACSSHSSFVEAYNIKSNTNHSGCSSSGCSASSCGGSSCSGGGCGGGGCGGCGGGGD